MNRYELALAETKSVLDEWFSETWSSSINPIVAQAVVERLVAKGVIQSTDPEDLMQR